MKNIFISIFCAVIFFYSCTETSEGFLDNKTNDEPDTEAMFADSSRTIAFHTGIYIFLGKAAQVPHNDAELTISDWKPYDAAADDSRHVFNAKSEFISAFNTGDFTGNGSNANYELFKRTWREMYGSIYRANVFLANYHKSPISDKLKESLATEARFLRAFFYFHLLRNYGGVSLVEDPLDPFTSHNYPRASYEETVNFIAEELRYCANTLPEYLQDEAVDYGRPTKGAALGILAKLYVDAASPLYNGGNVGVGAVRPYVGYEDFKLDRWTKAKETLEELMGLSAHYLDTTDNSVRAGNGFYNVTTKRFSRERIWNWFTTSGNAFPGKWLLPKTRAMNGGNPRVTPYNELVEAFPMKNGKAITDPSSGYDELDPYKNRDPRFYYTILYNGSEWIMAPGGAKVPIYTYRGHSDGYPNGTKTGFYFRKNVSEDMVTNVLTKEGSGFSFVRYADVMLMYAEVLTEINLDANRSIIEKQFFELRDRAGIEAGDGRYGVPVGMDKEEMLAFIMNERRIELANETGHRYFDLKRRKLFEKLDGVWSHAAVWDEAGSSYSLSLVPVQQHFFDSPRMYHFAIPQHDVNAAGLVQNPGW